jgi:hypothetical protein
VGLQAVMPTRLKISSLELTPMTTPAGPEDMYFSLPLTYNNNNNNNNNKLVIYDKAQRSIPLLSKF